MNVVMLGRATQMQHAQTPLEVIIVLVILVIAEMGNHAKVV